MQRGTTMQCWWACKLVHHAKQYGVSSKKLKVKLPKKSNIAITVERDMLLRRRLASSHAHHSSPNSSQLVRRQHGTHTYTPLLSHRKGRNLDSCCNVQGTRRHHVN